jgi:aminoglycoside 6'-N-acetyltransferase
MLFESGPLLVRRATEADVPTLTRWMRDPRVLRYFGGRNNVSDEARERENLFSNDIDIRCVFELNGRSIGYIQFCPSQDDSYGFAAADNMWGIDLYIGEPDLWGKGFGTQVVRAGAEWLLSSGKAVVVTIDPETWNVRAVRSYEKAGFRKHHFMPQCELHEGLYRDNWLMVFGQPSPYRVEKLNTLPIDAIEPLAQEAEAQDFAFMRRLIDDYTSGKNRFDKPGEAMFGAYKGNALVGFGGLNIDHYAHHPRMGRVRHVYVLAAHRRHGVGRDLLMTIITAAHDSFDLLRLRTNTDEGARFYKSLGFYRPGYVDHATHIIQFAPWPFP